MGGKAGKVGQGRADKALNDPPVSLDLPYRQWAITVGSQGGESTVYIQERLL